MSKIIHHTANGKHFLLVAVPEGAKNIEICEMGQTSVGISFSFPKDKNEYYYKVAEPQTELEFLFRASNASEQQARQVVDAVDYDLPPSPSNDFQGDWNSGYRDYECNEDAPNAEYPYVHSAKESLTTLINSLFLNHSGDVAVLEKL